MFLGIILFICSLLLEGYFFIFIDPDQVLNLKMHLIYLGFALNTGLLLGLIVVGVTFLVSYYLRAYVELEKRSFLKRGSLFGLYMGLITYLKLIGVLDVYLFTFITVIAIALDIILIEKNDI